MCGETALHHFLYRATPRAQFVMPAFSAPLTLPELCQVGRLSLPALQDLVIILVEPHCSDPFC